MTKLTTELLEKFVNDIKTDGMCDITDSQVESALIRLLAYEQAAKNPIAWVVGDEEIADFKNGREVCVMRDCDDEHLDYLPLYAAPVLPKQPELVMKHSSVIAEQLDHVLSGMDVTDHQRAVISCAVDRLNKNADTIHQLSKAACTFPDRLDYLGAKDLFNYLMNEEETNATVNGWNACRDEMLKAQPVSEPYKSAANDIIAERQRQISEEGWTPEHDDKYNDFQLALAAAGYAQNVADYAGEYCHPHSSIDWTDAPEPEAWPWSPVWWKPTNPRRDLVKAGALILAEIERMDRIAPAQEQK